jgi:hypothetical protein
VIASTKTSRIRRKVKSPKKELESGGRKGNVAVVFPNFRRREVITEGMVCW